MSKALAVISAAFNTFKSAYLWLVDWVDANPQKTIWAAAGLIVLALVL